MTFRDVLMHKFRGMGQRIRHPLLPNREVIEQEELWALRDINLEIRRGERVGIIGRNGAGKSTLLKVLSRITEPTEGRFSMNGRVASLLEVGTGFHPELTGRENIFLNGAILGMSKSEIKQKFDAIVDFAETEKFLDTPVKRYSSGMYVRLAFSVAAHLEPEILIVDEVLAVGDAAFQRKCLGKMEEVGADGRTVLFVSHNISAINSLCNRGIVLDNGRVNFSGDISSCIQNYLGLSNSIIEGHYVNKAALDHTDILDISVINSSGKVKTVFSLDEPITLGFRLKIAAFSKKAVLGIRVQDQAERNIFSSQTELSAFELSTSHMLIKVELPRNFLIPNSYRVSVGLHIPNVQVLRSLKGVVGFDIEDTGSGFQKYAGKDFGCVIANCKWSELNEDTFTE